MKLLKHTLFSIFCIIFFSCGTDSSKEKTPEEIENERYDVSLKEKLGAFSPLPLTAQTELNVSSPAKIRLGHNLYFDKQLSKEGNISCNSCHNLETFGVDNLANSPGDEGKNGDRNSPTVLNAALHSTQFWDGRAKNVEEQAGMPILNPIEMAIPNESFLIDRLSKDEKYKKLFSEAFPNQNNPINYENLRLAIASFERELITPSRFDDYLKGNVNALTLQEKKGLSSFINIGCTTCHAGEILGGNMFQKFGIHKNYWELTKSKTIDEGKFKVTGIESDKHVFKVPSLRNIEKTHPYFHDGSITSLEEAVEIMAIAQLNYNLSKDEKTNIVAFLKTLTGAVPIVYQKAP
ncbi:MAG: c-type cytochrome [Bacteroidetes bacterium]|nr:c-type cytochrome [Bacteroidota bacterium]